MCPYYGIGFANVCQSACVCVCTCNTRALNGGGGVSSMGACVCDDRGLDIIDFAPPWSKTSSMAPL